MSSPFDTSQWRASRPLPDAAAPRRPADRRLRPSAPFRRAPAARLAHFTLTAFFGCLLLGVPGARAQEVTESSLKAAMIYKFVIFTEWPNDVLPPAAPLKACVLGDASFSDSLGNYVKGRPVDGHTIVVSRVSADGGLRSCHLLYLSGISAKQAGQVAAGLSGSTVLTMSDLDPFAEMGGIAQLYAEDGRFRFKVNVSAVKRSQIALSSKLLLLVTRVKDDPPSEPR